MKMRYQIFSFYSDSTKYSIKIFDGCRIRLSTIFFILMLFAGINGISFSQGYSINNDLQKINIAMFETKNLSMEIDYNLYFDNTIRSQMHGLVKKNGRMLYQQVGAVTVVKNDKYSVFVHNDQKLLVLDPNAELDDPIKKEDLLRINIDTLKSWVMGSELSENNNTRTIIFTLKKGEYSRIIIDYDPVSYFLKRMELHAKNMHTTADQKQYKVWMEVMFVNTTTSQEFSLDDFSEKKYVDIKSKEIVKPTGVFKDYRFINNLNKSIKYDKTK